MNQLKGNSFATLMPIAIWTTRSAHLIHAFLHSLVVAFILGVYCAGKKDVFYPRNSIDNAWFLYLVAIYLILLYGMLRKNREIYRTLYFMSWGVYVFFYVLPPFNELKFKRNDYVNAYLKLGSFTFFERVFIVSGYRLARMTKVSLPTAKKKVEIVRTRRTKKMQVLLRSVNKISRLPTVYPTYIRKQ
ncbi:hypothetical protein WR25_01275 [Diploscapter pachys]|uniref:Uncharacterized protein n=1 Tax=Diploscapter pachys TaxID=2018661 RepID=A0A2A2LY21_9BILA|nr:hypothetical protein WR25_01275 [Diploscapter pachys]